MPSWNIHTAHVERLLARHTPESLGIADANAFLFGNYVPDIYVGFMVPDVTMHIDYCMTHLAAINTIPMPDADRFWDDYIYRRRPASAAGMSLTMGAWAHLLTDRIYNGSFRAFCETHDVPKGEELRKLKQGDFDLFGRSLGIETLVNQTPELVEAAQGFWQYSVLPPDVERSVQVANSIVRGDEPTLEFDEHRLLDRAWLDSVFAFCDEWLATWLETWQRLERDGGRPSAADVRNVAPLPMFGER